MKTIRMLLIFCFLLISSCSSSSNENSVSFTDISYNYSSDEIEIMSLINDYRSKIGENKLGVINYLSEISREHNFEMIKSHDISHSGFQERANEITEKIRAINVAENIAYNYKTEQSALNAWLDSPTHRKNIEGDFTDFGLAVSEDDVGRKYYTVILVKV